MSDKNEDAGDEKGRKEIRFRMQRQAQPLRARRWLLLHHRRPFPRSQRRSSSCLQSVVLPDSRLPAIFRDDGSSSIPTFSSSTGLAEHNKRLMGNITKYMCAITIRTGNDTLDVGSVWSADVSFCATAPMMDLRLFEAVSANESMAFPTTEAQRTFRIEWRSRGHPPPRGLIEHQQTSRSLPERRRSPDEQKRERTGRSIP